jgi:hypothetical protein
MQPAEDAVPALPLDRLQPLQPLISVLALRPANELVGANCWWVESAASVTQQAFAGASKPVGGGCVVERLGTITPPSPSPQLGKH